MLPGMEEARCAQARWAAMPLRQRRIVLRRLRHAIADTLDEIVATIADEAGKPPLDILSGDAMVTLECLRYYERRAGDVLRPRRVGAPPLLFRGAKFEERREPHGVVLIFAPWNYPFQLAMIPAITALYAGNAVMLKCSEHAARTAQLIGGLFERVGFPAGLVQVCADPPEVAQGLLEQGPDFLFFTGSSSNGRELARMAAERWIPAAWELGGKDPCLVFASSDPERTVEGVCYAAFSNAGQVCVGAKRIYVDAAIYEEFLEALAQRSGRLRIGNRLDCDMGAIRMDAVRARLAQQLEDALAHGARLHTEWDRQSAAVPPLILSQVPRECALLAEESFGPIVVVEPFRDEREAIAKANASEYALSASVFTGDDAQAERVAAGLRCGSVTVNDAIRHVGNPYAAFGGNGRSGHGRYHGAAGLRLFTRTKTVMRVTRPRRREMHWFPFTEQTYRGLRALMTARHASGSLASRARVLLELANSHNSTDSI